MTHGKVHRLAFGHGHEVAGIVYGTVIAMATLTAAYVNVKDHWKLIGIVWTTLFVLWVAHVYAHGLGESIGRGHRLDRAELKSISRRELSILLAAVGPTLPLVLVAAGVLTLSTAVWLALGIGLGVLGFEGLRYARLEKLGLLGTVGVTVLNLALGSIVVVLKIVVSH